MTVAYTFNSVAREQYEPVFHELMDGGMSHEGLILHAAGAETDGKWRIIEVWESDESKGRWERDALMPALQRHGVDTTQGPPEWTRVEVQTLVTR